MKKALVFLTGILTGAAVLGCTLHVHLWGKYYTPEEPCKSCETFAPTSQPVNPDLQYIYELGKENP